MMIAMRLSPFNNDFADFFVNGIGYRWRMVCICD